MLIRGLEGSFHQRSWRHQGKLSLAIKCVYVDARNRNAKYLGSYLKSLGYLTGADLNLRAAWYVCRIRKVCWNTRWYSIMQDGRTG